MQRRVAKRRRPARRSSTCAGAPAGFRNSETRSFVSRTIRSIRSSPELSPCARRRATNAAPRGVPDASNAKRQRAPVRADALRGRWVARPRAGLLRSVQRRKGEPSEQNSAYRSSPGARSAGAVLQGTRHFFPRTKT